MNYDGVFIQKYQKEIIRYYILGFVCFLIFCILVLWIFIIMNQYNLEMKLGDGTYGSVIKATKIDTG